MNHIRGITQMNDIKRKNKNGIAPNDINTLRKEKQNLMAKYVYFAKCHLDPNNIDSLVRSLPTSGFLKHYPLTSYWCVSLGDMWQNQSLNIAKLSYLHVEHSTEYNQSIHTGKLWASMVDNANPTISCVTPPSIAGFHISLGSWAKDDKKRPKCLIEGEAVSFRITNIKTIPSIRNGPQNIEGQFTNEDGLRFYPTLWIIADIEFIDFEYVTKYPPHISLACVAVQLSVHKVDKLEFETKKVKESIESKTDE